MVETELDGFRGRYDKVWVAENECKSFLTEAEELDRTRAGTAVLEAMSPGEFRLEGRVSDSAGHVELATALRIVKY